MERVEIIRITDRQLGLSELQEDKTREIVLTVNTIAGADMQDTAILMENIKNEYLRYRARVSEYRKEK